MEKKWRNCELHKVNDAEAIRAIRDIAICIIFRMKLVTQDIILPISKSIVMEKWQNLLMQLSLGKQFIIFKNRKIERKVNKNVYHKSTLV